MNYLDSDIQDYPDDAVDDFYADGDEFAPIDHRWRLVAAIAGIVFALADSAFAFACNSHNESTVAAAATIDFLAAARAGDELTAEASELWRSKRNGIYEITVSNQRGERIALFRGRSYRIDGQVVSGE